ncbi:unnamed protein product [Chironomus riparius]|uniref:N-acetyltransferase domain-containing protein n=1 Tax=Chironomus riparius TaxID=315576 RepID=A0A9N9RXE6_9DIPT|nr:unnamed protein product [Chironomus riparius]
MSTEFVVYPRRDGVPYPQIYSRFKVKSEDVEDEFFIQDLTVNYFDMAVDFIVENHARGAVFHRAAGTIGTEAGVDIIRKNYRAAFEQRVSLICIDAKTNEIAGLNALYLASKFDPPKPESDDPNFRKLNQTLKFIEESFNVYEHYGVDRVMFAAGLCVDKTYRGRGIATEILKARAHVLKAIGVEVTSSIFSTVGAQKAAKAAGYDENFSISYEDMDEKLPSLNFSHGYGNTCKVLSLKVK